MSTRRGSQGICPEYRYYRFHHACQYSMRAQTANCLAKSTTSIHGPLTMLVYLFCYMSWQCEHLGCGKRGKKVARAAKTKVLTGLERLLDSRKSK